MRANDGLIVLGDSDREPPIFAEEDEADNAGDFDGVRNPVWFDEDVPTTDKLDDAT